MTVAELELIQRTLGGINGISEVMEFIRVYQSDLALRERNPDVSHYIRMQCINRSLGYAINTLSQLAVNEASNINITNLTAEER
ncbi:MAG: hypothetical protein KZQ92_06730 [Candidatus Thiodiazotropha sp. (ex Lucinoma borealis)]|nr:hypothetical protein [Candidatus Thiodiazotropha sp. (ex Lucinoma borealis)]